MPLEVKNLWMFVLLILLGRLLNNKRENNFVKYAINQDIRVIDFQDDGQHTFYEISGQIVFFLYLLSNNFQARITNTFQY